MSTMRFGQHVIKASAVFLRTELSFALVNRKPVVPGRILLLALGVWAAVAVGSEWRSYGVLTTQAYSGTGKWRFSRLVSLFHNRYQCVFLCVSLCVTHSLTHSTRTLCAQCSTSIGPYCCLATVVVFCVVGMSLI